MGFIVFQAVLDVLNFYDSSKDKETTAKYMTVSKPFGKCTLLAP